MLLTPASAQVLAPYTAIVKKVVDGDTLILNNGEHVRLLGINTPERGKKQTPDQPLADAAFKRLRSLFQGRVVKVRPGVEPRDRHGRLLATVQAPDGMDVSQILLSEGLGWMVAIAPNTAHVEKYQAAERRARRASLGVWGLKYYAPLPASELDNHTTGFRLVQGRVTRIGRGKKNLYLNLGEGFAVNIPRASLIHFTLPPERLLNRNIIVQGWINWYQGRAHMRISHPAMIEARQ
ncbi:MAG: thermonuclease family protein [Gammaproteobacteria bacterium]|nr:MAG: thermonuclease family protein [Gammaproteobacteria bacterium]